MGGSVSPRADPDLLEKKTKSSALLVAGIEPKFQPAA
jgi:hypothetical protein